MEGKIVFLKSFGKLRFTFFTHIAKRHTAGTDIPTEDVQRFLDRDRVNVREQCFYKRNNICLHLRGPCYLAMPGSKVAAIIMPTDEELMIARDTAAVVSAR